MQVRWTTAAAEDLETIADYLFERHPQMPRGGSAGSFPSARHCCLSTDGPRMEESNYQGEYGSGGITAPSVIKCSVPTPETTRFLRQLSAPQEALDKIVFPKLVRPPVGPDSDPTAELVTWGIRLYCFCVISHFRELQQSLLLLVENDRVPASLIITRSLFETAAHTYYVNKHISQFLAPSDFTAAWEFLSQLHIGSRYMREEYGEEAEEFPEPRKIAKIVQCFTEYMKLARTKSTYSFLSEFSHPNAAALSQYYEWHADSVARNTYVTFHEPAPERMNLVLPDAGLALTATLHNILELLWQGGDRQTASQVRTAVDALLAAHSDASAAASG